MGAPLPIIAKLSEQVGTGHFYDDGYACVVPGNRYEMRAATEMKRAANRDGSEAAAMIQELYDALVKARNTLAGCGMAYIAADICDAALARARGETADA